ncbi:MAG TPA: PP2C family protein-serine/threonine phosphatase [Actinocrinis sp.]
MTGGDEDFASNLRVRRVSNLAVAGWTLGVSAAALAAGYFAGSTLHLAGVLVFLPAAVAALGSVRQTAFVAGWIDLVALSGLLWQPGASSLDKAFSVLFAAGFGALSVVACRTRLNRTEQLLRLRSTATAMQRSILRPLPILTDQVLVTGVYEPVHEEKLVGGDVYDVAATPFGTRVLIADVQGKGLGAIGLGFAVLGAFRAAAHREHTLTALADALEDAVLTHNTDAAHAGRPERFVTALVLGIDDDREVQAVDCGHPAPYLLADSAASLVALGEAGPPLGLASLAPLPRIVSWFPFPPRATLLLCTDGLIEARSPDGAFFPLAERLSAGASLAPEDLARSLRQQSLAFAQGMQQDDTAILILRRAPAARNATNELGP